MEAVVAGADPGAVGGPLVTVPGRHQSAWGSA